MTSESESESKACREMTLDEFVGTLHHSHRVHRDLAALRERAVTRTKHRDEIVRELEVWYFGCAFANLKEDTEVGNWRDIVNEAARIIVAERARSQALVEALEEVEDTDPRYPNDMIRRAVVALATHRGEQPGEDARNG